MRNSDNFNLGSVQIHPKVIAEIVFNAISEMEGVRLIQENLTSTIVKIFNKKDFHGVKVDVDSENPDQIIIEVKVIIQYGLNIPDIARQIQDSIRQAIQKTADISIKDININIQGIERGQKQ